ncbi:PcfK-like family protein [Myroides sp. NP-2]|uniref:PcfK-like family protein n=1 Tax=Myroides sp. NP-2 TaxID=2759945 RepID=UPI0015F91F64|nr:PcfK-like family protein [Myroides sp. NP-2]MBB1150256.1 PcfK-like family protein [Myroides sp. NP-2]
MKASNTFTNIIKSHLDNRAKNDTLFATTYAKENKNIDDCITYILNQVKESGCNGFADDEIFSMAVHYYDEDDIKIGKKISCKVVVNHKEEVKPQKTTEPIKTVKPQPKQVKKTDNTQIQMELNL